jgi:hypothetical protein
MSLLPAFKDYTAKDVGAYDKDLPRDADGGVNQKIAEHYRLGKPENPTVAPEMAFAMGWTADWRCIKFTKKVKIQGKDVEIHTYRYFPQYKNEKGEWVGRCPFYTDKPNTKCGIVSSALPFTNIDRFYHTFGSLAKYIKRDENKTNYKYDLIPVGPKSEKWDEGKHASFKTCIEFIMELYNKKMMHHLLNSRTEDGLHYICEVMCPKIWEAEKGNYKRVVAEIKHQFNSNSSKMFTTYGQYDEDGNIETPPRFQGPIVSVNYNLKGDGDLKIPFRVQKDMEDWEAWASQQSKTPYSDEADEWEYVKGQIIDSHKGCTSGKERDNKRPKHFVFPTVKRGKKVFSGPMLARCNVSNMPVSMVIKFGEFKYNDGAANNYRATCELTSMTVYTDGQPYSAGLNDDYDPFEDEEEENGGQGPPPTVDPPTGDKQIPADPPTKTEETNSPPEETNKRGSDTEENTERPAKKIVICEDTTDEDE